MKQIFIYLLLLVITATVFGQNIYVVTKTTDPNPFTDPYKFNDADCDPDMLGTLQWAINKSNDDNAESVIEFNIPGNGPHEIVLNSYLPQIKQPVTINAETQAGYIVGTPAIIINGQNKFNSGIDSYYATTRIFGLNIKNFINHGVLLSGSNNSEVRNCVITSIVNNNDYKTPAIGIRIVGCNNVSVYGSNIQTKLNSPGSLAPTYGIFIDKSFYCVIGGTNQGQANIIANCGNTGVAVRGCDYNKISGNSIYLNEKAIEMIYNANGGIQPPVIASYTNGILSGTALPNSTVEVFGSTGVENANEYLVSVVADESGEWTVFIENTNNYFTTIQISMNANSSSLSIPFLIIPNSNCSLDCIPAYEGECNLICNSNMYCPSGYDCGMDELPPGWCSSHGSSNGMNWDDPPTFLSTQVGGYITFTGCGGGDPFDPDNPTAPSCPNVRSEGVMTKFLNNLVVGQDYKLSFYRAHENNIEDFYIKFINTQSVGLPDGLDDWTLPVIPLVPGECEIIYHEQPVPNNFVWTYTEIYFTATQPYDGLWLYSEVNTAHQYGVTFINGVKLIPVLDAVDEVNFGPACMNYGSELQLSVLNQDAIGYEWSGPNNFHSNIANPVVSTFADETMSGTYFVTVSFVHDCIYRAHYDVPISHVEVGIRIGTPGLGDEIIPDNEITICPYEIRYLRAVPDPLPSGNSLYLYEWNTGFTEENVYSIINITGEPPLTYNVTVTNENGCFATSSFTVNHHPVPPTPTVSNTGPACAGGTVELIADIPPSDGQDYIYHWSRYAADFMTYENHLYVYNLQNTLYCNGFDEAEEWLVYGMDGGLYTLNVYNQYGCYNSATTDVEVVPQIAGCISANNDGAYCYGDEITLFVDHPVEGAGLDTEYIYEWSGPDGFTASGLIVSPGNANPLTAGTYYLTITPYTENHIQMPQCAQVLTTEVVVLELEDLLYYHQSPYCEGDLIKLIPEPVIEGVTYNWYNQDGFIISDQELVYEYATTDLTGPYYYTVTTGTGCTHTSYEAYIHVDPAPEVNIEVLNNINLPDLGSVMIHYESEELYGYYMTVTHHVSGTMPFWGNVNSEFIQLDNLQAGQYDVVIESFNGCQKEYTFFIFGPTSDIEIICNVKPRTCNSSNIAIVEFTINGGDPPYNVNIFADDILVSEGNVYNNPGTYTIEIENLPTPTYLINIVATDIFSQEAVSECGNYVFAWLPGNQVTNENLQSSYSGVTLYIGDENNQTLNVSQDVTFKYCTIYCATFDYNNVAETKWKVAAPYDLKFVNCTIKSGCDDKMWDGIDVLGSNLPQNYSTHASIEVINTEMADAIKGIESYQGGIINTTNSVYRNNVYDICFNNFENTQSLEKIEKNTFITDDLLNDPNKFPRSHVFLDRVKDVTFKGNTFSNTLPWYLHSGIEYYAEMRGCGIDARLSSFTVTPTSAISPSMVISTNINSFSGLYYGVKVNGQGNTAPKIQHCNFNDNFRGVKLTGTTGARVIYNKFYTTFNDVPVQMLGYTANNTMSYDASYAAYLDRATNTWFEENKIFNGQAGAYVYNTGSNGGTRFYRNNFGRDGDYENFTPRGMDAATVVVGSNSDYEQYNVDHIGEYGLQVRCNDYMANDFAISVFNGNMRVKQGENYTGVTTDKLAGNQFHSTLVNGIEFNVNVDEEPGFLYDYSDLDIGVAYEYNQHVDFGSEENGYDRELQSFTSLKVDPETNEERYFVTTQSCPSNFGLHHFNHGTAISDIATRKSQSDSKQAQYNRVVDRGNTTQLKTVAESVNRYNYLASFIVLSNNGYLSDIVFEALINNQNSPNAATTAILIVNSPLPEKIKKMVYTCSLPTWQKALILFVQNGENNRVKLENEISGLNQEIFDIESELVNNAINNDSTNTVIDATLNYYNQKSDKDYNDYINIYKLNLSADNPVNAGTTLSQIRSFAATQTPEIAEELITFCDVNEVYLDYMLEELGDTLLLVQNKEMLFEAARSTSSLYSATAEILYSYTTDSSFYEYTPMPFEVMTPRSVEVLPDETELFKPQINVYPNPSDGLVFVDYNFAEHYTDGYELIYKALGIEQKDNCEHGEIRVYTNDAKLLQTIPLNALAGMITIDIRSYTPGTYLLEIADCFGNAETVKITKTY